MHSYPLVDLDLCIKYGRGTFLQHRTFMHVSNALSLDFNLNCVQDLNISGSIYVHLYHKETPFITLPLKS